MVSANLSKMTGNQSLEDEKILSPYVKIALGISLLGKDKYDEAALSFLQADASVAASTYSEIASQNDVAVYGGLLALRYDGPTGPSGTGARERDVFVLSRA